MRRAPVVVRLYRVGRRGGSGVGEGSSCPVGSRSLWCVRGRYMTGLGSGIYVVLTEIPHGPRVERSLYFEGGPVGFV